MRGRYSAEPRRPKNVPEGIFFDDMKEKGLLASKRGWPDFAVWDKKGNLVGIVEVKPHRGRSLKREQIAILIAFAKAGIPCYRWSPQEGFYQIVVSDGLYSEKIISSEEIHGVLE